MFDKLVIACTAPSRELCRQFCYAVMEGLTEGLFCCGVGSIPVSHIGISRFILHIEMNDVMVLKQATDGIVTLQRCNIQTRIHIHIPQM